MEDGVGPLTAAVAAAVAAADGEARSRSASTAKKNENGDGSAKEAATIYPAWPRGPRYETEITGH